MLSSGLNLNSNDHYLMACSIFGRFRTSQLQMYGAYASVYMCLFLYPISLSNCEYIMSTYDSKYLRSIQMKHQFITRASFMHFTVFFTASFSSMVCSIFLCSSRAENRMKKLIYAKFSLQVFLFSLLLHSLLLHETNAFQPMPIFFFNNVNDSWRTKTIKLSMKRNGENSAHFLSVRSITIDFGCSFDSVG